MKVSVKREVNGATWQLTALGSDQDIVAVGNALFRAIKPLLLLADRWRAYVTHDSASEMLFEAADSLASSEVWFNGLKADNAYTVLLQLEKEGSSIEVEVLTVYPERLEDGQVPPFA